MATSGIQAFRLEADNQGFIRAYDRSGAAMNALNAAFVRGAQAGKKQDDVLTKLSSTATRLGGMLAGAGLVGGAVKAFGDSMERSAQAAVAFDDAVTPLLSLGDNLTFAQDIRKNVLDMSVGFGRARDDIANLRFTVQSGAASMSEDMRQQVVRTALDLSKIYGGSPEGIARALFKSEFAFKKGIARTADILGEIADKAELTMEQMQTFLPDVLPVAETLGFTFEELGAAIEIATSAGGRTEKTFTGLRNLLIRMTEAEKHGIELTGDFVNKLDQLSELRPQQMLKLFGAEAVAVASSVVRMREEVAGAIEQLKQLEEGRTGFKLSQRLGDPAFVVAEALRVQEQFKANLPLDRGGAVDMGALQLGNIRTGLRAQLPRLLAEQDWIVNLTAAILQLSEKVGPTAAGAIGAATSVEQLQRAGRFDEADALRELNITMMGLREALYPKPIFRHLPPLGY